MVTPIFSLPDVSGSVVSFAQLNIIQVIQEALAQAVIVDSLTTPPGSPANGAMYRVVSTATDAWTGEEDNLAVNVSGAWYFPQFAVVNEGYEVYNRNLNHKEMWNGSKWIVSPSGNGVNDINISANGILTYYPVMDINPTVGGLTMTIESIATNAHTKILNSNGTNSVTVETVVIPANGTQSFFTVNGSSWTAI